MAAADAMQSRRCRPPRAESLRSESRPAGFHRCVQPAWSPAMTSRRLVLSVLCLVPASLAFGADWPQFRGTAVSGLSAETDLPSQWSTDKNVAWKAKVAGAAWSSPVVWGDKVFLTTAVSAGGRGEAPRAEAPKQDDAK